jgi:hypothetical protein
MEHEMGLRTMRKRAGEGSTAHRAGSRALSHSSEQAD